MTRRLVAMRLACAVLVTAALAGGTGARSQGIREVAAQGDTAQGDAAQGDAPTVHPARATPVGSLDASALNAYGELENPALQSRFERITHDLRCLVCQNESIADSNVELAADLRRQVREMLAAGRSDDAIFKFMTDRYGEFVRFNPPLEAKTLLIWGAPFIALALACAIVLRVTRARARMPLDDESTAGS